VEGGYHVSIVQDAHLGETATKIVFWIYTTMQICKQEMASKIVFWIYTTMQICKQEMAPKIVFWIYTTMQICKQEMASKIVFRLHNNAHLRVRDGYKNCLWIMQQCTSAPKDGYKRFVFGLCNMVCTCL
jgi:hypothetical protein